MIWPYRLAPRLNISYMEIDLAIGLRDEGYGVWQG
jgi:hypothetical protein